MPSKQFYIKMAFARFETVTDLDDPKGERVDHLIIEGGFQCEAELDAHCGQSVSVEKLSENGIMSSASLFVDDLTTASPIQLQDAIIGLAQSGIQEKFRLEFKQTWDPEKQCQDIAAFANTYGGLLVLGITDDRQRFPGIPVPPKSDLRTQLATIIATRIDPVPVFEIHTCPAPMAAPNELVVIRISAQPRLHLCLKGDKPIYIRNEDSSVPAKAADIRALIERARLAETGVRPRVDLDTDFVREFYIMRKMPQVGAPANLCSDGRFRSETFCRIGVAPEYPVAFSLDATFEARFREAILRLYPSLGERLRGNPAGTIQQGGDRGSSWYFYKISDSVRNHEVAWAINDSGVIQFIGETAERIGNEPTEYWSIVDFFMSVEATIRLVHAIWSLIKYYGMGQIGIRLKVGGLKPIAESGFYSSLFYGSNHGIPDSLIRSDFPDTYEVPSGNGFRSLSYDDRNLRIRRSLALLGNQVLRDLRFRIEMSELQRSLESFNAW